MAWTAPATVVHDQLLTAAFWNEQIRDNQAVIRAGGFSVASQATGDLLVATFSDLVGRVAAADGLPFYSGSAWSFVNPFSITYPIGAIYLTTEATNPASLFGIGTWVAIGSGRCLYGFDATQAAFDAVEEAGGVITHTLTTAELPVHTHVINDPTHTHQVPDNARRGSARHPLIANPRDYPSAGTSQTSTDTTGITVGSTGGGALHSNLAPSITIYIWKRTA